MVLYDGVTVAVMGELSTPRYVCSVSTCLPIFLYYSLSLYCFLFFHPLSSDYAAAQRHPCGLEFVNLTFIIEALFSFATLQSLIQDKEPFDRMLQKAKRCSVELNSVEKLCEFYELHRTSFTSEKYEHSTVKVETSDIRNPESETDSKIENEQSKKARIE